MTSDDPPARYEPAARDLLAEWFGDFDDTRPAPEEGDPIARRWFVADPAFDAMLRRRFGALAEAAAAGTLDGWAAPPRGQPELAVALVLALDQLPRNLYRGRPEAFAEDAHARDVARTILDGPWYAKMPRIHRAFVLMPLMHSESIEDHDEAVARFEALVEDAADSPRADLYRNFLHYEHKHRDIVARFGRYPHRNEILGRRSTAEELAFLEQPGSRF
ncbi:MAG: DUF924 domain-containing protein [Deltaproteobacteria bacterium]|nr:MAG: DUF924 domain-containing protein [Deltaproteobacteria bacterium]